MRIRDSTSQSTAASNTKATTATRCKWPSVHLPATGEILTSAQWRRPESWSTSLPTVMRGMRSVSIVCACKPNWKPHGQCHFILCCVSSQKCIQQVIISCDIAILPCSRVRVGKHT